MNVSQADLWIAEQLAKLLGTHPPFDFVVQSAIRHGVLGGFWYGMALFVFWVQASRQGQLKLRQRVLTTFLGSLIAIAFSLVAELLISHLPPSQHPGLKGLYPDYFEINTNTNSFPSQSTTLYSAVTAGVYSLNRRVGTFLWVGLALLVALPRMYVGGHYLSNIVAGLILGSVGYALPRRLLEQSLVSRFVQASEAHSWRRIARDVVVYAWILQVAIGFRDAVWLKRGLASLLSMLLRS